jgi:hypothetical protein
MGRTCDARKEIACPGRLGGAGQPTSRTSGWAGCFGRVRSARYLPWSSEERGPGSEAPPLAWSPLPAPSRSGVVHHAIRSDGGLQPRESGSWYCSGTQCPREEDLRAVGARRRPLSGHFGNSRSEKREEGSGTFFSKNDSTGADHGSSDLPVLVRPTQRRCTHRRHAHRRLRPHQRHAHGGRRRR